MSHLYFEDAEVGSIRRAGPYLVSKDEIIQFANHRPVEVDGAARNARFRAVRMKGGEVPYGRVFFIHHFTRDLLWRDEWRHHANGVVAVVRAMIVDADPVAGTKLYADMFGPEVVRDIKGGRTW